MALYSKSFQACSIKNKSFNYADFIDYFSLYFIYSMNIGCARHSSSKLNSALTCTNFLLSVLFPYCFLVLSLCDLTAVLTEIKCKNKGNILQARAKPSQLELCRTQLDILYQKIRLSYSLDFQKTLTRNAPKGAKKKLQESSR